MVMPMVAPAIAATPIADASAVWRVLPEGAVIAPIVASRRTALDQRTALSATGHHWMHHVVGRVGRPQRRGARGIVAARDGAVALSLQLGPERRLVAWRRAVVPAAVG